MSWPFALTGVKKKRQDEQDFEDEQDAGWRRIEGALKFVLGQGMLAALLTTISDLHPVHPENLVHPVDSSRLVV